MRYKSGYEILNPLFVMLMAGVVLVFSCTGGDPDDRSLSLSEYRTIGMPDPNRDWQINEISLAYSVLENLQSNNPEGLPLKGSKKSGMIFERMLSEDNLTLLADVSRPGEERLSVANALLNMCENWFRIYTGDLHLKTYYQDELTAILQYGLHVTERTLDIVDGIAGDDDEFVNKVRSRYLSGLFAVLIEQQSDHYSPHNLQQMSEQLVASINKHKHWMNAITKEDLKRALGDVVAKVGDEKITAGYSSLSREL